MAFLLRYPPPHALREIIEGSFQLGIAVLPITFSVPFFDYTPYPRTAVPVLGSKTWGSIQGFFATIDEVPVASGEAIQAHASENKDEIEVQSRHRSQKQPPLLR